MKRRSFFARVFGLAAASAVAPEAMNAVLVPTQEVAFTSKFVVNLQFNADHFIAGMKRVIRDSDALAEVIASSRRHLLQRERDAPTSQPPLEITATPLDGSRE